MFFPKTEIFLSAFPGINFLFFSGLILFQNWRLFVTYYMVLFVSMFDGNHNYKRVLLKIKRAKVRTKVPRYV